MSWELRGKQAGTEPKKGKIRTTAGGTSSATELTTEEEGHQAKFYFHKSLEEGATIMAQMVLSGGQGVEIRTIVSGRMQSLTGGSFVDLSGLHYLEKSTLAKGKLSIMQSLWN